MSDATNQTYTDLPIKGMTFIEVSSGEDWMKFLSEDLRTYLFAHSQDCCEEVKIEDICGNLSDLEGVPLIVAENPGLDDAALRKKATEAYPFGPRESFPYKAWLKAMNEVFGPSEKKKAAEKRKLEGYLQRIGQLSLPVDEQGNGGNFRKKSPQPYYYR